MVHPIDADCEISYTVDCSSFVSSPAALYVVYAGHYPAARLTARFAV